MSVANTITILLQLEAINKADKAFQEISGSLKEMSGSLKDAASSSELAGEGLANAQLKAEAAGNAYVAAMDEQRAALVGLQEATDALTLAQQEAAVKQAELAASARQVASADVEAKAEAEAYYRGVRVEAAAAADAVKKASAEQVVALDGLSKAEDEAARRSKAAAEAQATAAGESDASAKSMSGLKTAGMGAAAAIAGIGYESLKAAGNFQAATTVLVTSGGETEQNIGMVRDGIMHIATETGTATDGLIKGMYMIGSAGYTGGVGLKVLQAAAMGAKAENANLGTVSNALTTVMTNYYGKITDAATAQKDATVTMNELIKATSLGKTTTEAMAGSLAQVLPIASATKIKFVEVAGAMAQMTSEGMSADQASQDLRHTIDKLNNPTAAMTKEMANYGISAQDVQSKLGERGLTGTLEILTKAITDKMGPAGRTIIDSFNQSKLYAQDADIEYKKLPPTLQQLADKVKNGTISYKDFNTALKDLSPQQRSLMQQWENLNLQADGFNNLLKAGSPAAETYQQALKNMTGDATTMTTTLMLTGNNLDGFKDKVNQVGQEANSAGKGVQGWADIQNNFNQQLAVAKQNVEVLAIKIGTDLMPIVQDIIKFFVEHKRVAEILATTIGVTLVAATAAWIAITIGQGFTMMANFVKWMTGMKAGAAEVALAEDAAAMSTKGLAISMSSLAGPIGLVGLALTGNIPSLTTTKDMTDKVSLGNKQLNDSFAQVAGGSKGAAVKLAEWAQVQTAVSINSGKTTANIQEIDAALAQLVSSGHADEAKKIIQDMGDSWGKSGASFNKFTDDLPNYQNALKSATAQQKATGDSAQTAAGQVNDLTMASQKLDNQISNASALTQMKLDMQNLGDAIQQNGRDLSDNTKAGLANQQQFNQLAQEIIQYRDQQIQATGDTNTANKTFNDQYNELIKTAQSFGYGKDAVVAYLKQIGLIPQNVQTTVHANTGPAVQDLNGLLQLIDSSQGYVQIYGAGGGKELLPGKAGGGNVQGNQAYWIGENGPEVFIPNADGYIVPNEQLKPVVTSNTSYSRVSSSSSQVAVNFNISIPGMIAAGPQSAQWILNIINQEFVQKILPQAGTQLTRVTS